MKLSFQKSIASSQATLPIVSVVVFVFWFLLPPVQPPLPFSTPDDGLWKYMPSFLQEGYWTLSIGALCAALGVYLMAELNNANMLLRVSSRMLSSMLAILLFLVVTCHRFQPGHVIMLLSLISFFPLFTTYQQPNPLLTFITYLLVSVASLVFPKLLWIVPFYWFIQGYFRAFSLRCGIASILAVMVPYWFYAGIAALTGSITDFLIHCKEVISFQVFDYTQIDVRNIILYLFILLLFVTGTIDFYIHQFMDKTRTRIIYNALIFYGILVALWIGIQPQHFTTLLPLLLPPTSIIFGHFFTLTHTRFSHIYCIVIMVVAVAVVVMQYLPSRFLPFTPNL